jgi:hypothetical protein
MLETSVPYGVDGVLHLDTATGAGTLDVQLPGAARRLLYHFTRSQNYGVLAGRLSHFNIVNCVPGNGVIRVTLDNRVHLLQSRAFDTPITTVTVTIEVSHTENSSTRPSRRIYDDNSEEGNEIDPPSYRYWGKDEQRRRRWDKDLITSATGRPWGYDDSDEDDTAFERARKKYGLPKPSDLDWPY